MTESVEVSSDLNVRKFDALQYASNIVSAYVSKNSIQTDSLPDLIRDVYSTLVELGQDLPITEDLTPAVSIKKSVTDDFIICLEDGKKFKSLKRHLRSKYDMTPEEYREKWGLPYDYPMVAPSYARKRSTLAKEMGLGRAKK